MGQVMADYKNLVRLNKAITAIITENYVEAGKLAFESACDLVGTLTVKTWLTDLDAKEVNKTVDKEEEEKLKNG